MRGVLAFALFAAVLTITPGLDTVLVIRTAAMRGRRPAAAAALGIGLGVLCWATASALGITALLTASHVAYEVLRWAGVGYLLYLGARTLWRTRHPAATEQQPGPEPAKGALDAFRVGLTTNLLNPKIGVFYLSVLPPFLPAHANPLGYSLVLALIHDVEGLVWFALLIVLVGRVAAWLSRPAVARRLEQLTALAFVGFGLRLALEKAP
jgi:threonine/homoserine/homoserine lactone efflux protein